jgi:hypothetical protein
VRAKKDGLDTYCRLCRNAKSLEARKRNPDKTKEILKRSKDKNRDKVSRYNRAYYAANSESQRARAKAWRDANPDKVKHQAKRVPKDVRAAQNKSWRDRNLDSARAKRRSNYANNRENEQKKHREWLARNKDSVAEYQRQRLKNSPEKNRFARSLRRAAEKRATPSWADKKAMLAIYKEAVRLTQLTGIQHHVDHKVPLQSPWVCGLHCEANLQILPYYENQSKSNRVWPDMPDLIGCSPQQIAA